ncbi:MAG: glutaredoxin family protein [Chloroflexi bacterium]|nr:glutaredoxin family protein [Chloroflexota bacterium]
MVKEFLSRKGVEFVAKDVSSDIPARQELARLTRRLRVPVTALGEEYVEGFDRPGLERLVGRLEAERGLD